MEDVTSNPGIGKKFFGAEINCPRERMLTLTFLSHFLPLQLARGYLDLSTLPFLLPLES